jgi:hypothetical protein
MKTNNKEDDDEDYHHHNTGTGWKQTMITKMATAVHDKGGQ